MSHGNTLSSAEITALSSPRRFSDEVTTVLVSRIRSGVYPPGSKLPATRELAESFQVSPPIIREALSRLKYDGYIEPRQGAGVYVLSAMAMHSLRLELEGDDAQQRLDDVYEMRLHVEQSCAELASTRHQPEDLAALRGHLACMEQALLRNEDGTEADVQFHLQIAKATGNQALWQLASYLHGTMATSVRTARENSNRTPGRPAQAQQEHEAIYLAISNRQPLLAREAMRRHLEGAARRLGLKFVAL